MSKKTTRQPAALAPDVQQIAAAVAWLHANRFQTIAEACVFCTATTHEDPTVGAIAKLAGMPFSTASRVVFSLVERGLLALNPHPGDRRKKIVSVRLAAS